MMCLTSYKQDITDTPCDEDSFCLEKQSLEEVAAIMESRANKHVIRMTVRHKMQSKSNVLIMCVKEGHYEEALECARAEGYTEEGGPGVNRDVWVQDGQRLRVS